MLSSIIETGDLVRLHRLCLYHSIMYVDTIDSTYGTDGMLRLIHSSKNGKILLTSKDVINPMNRSIDLKAVKELVKYELISMSSNTVFNEDEEFDVSKVLSMLLFGNDLGFYIQPDDDYTHIMTYGTTGNSIATNDLHNNDGSIRTELIAMDEKIRSFICDLNQMNEEKLTLNYTFGMDGEDVLLMYIKNVDKKDCNENR